MPEKQKTHNWTKIQTMIATSAMFGLLTLFNVIASLDRHKINDNPEIPSTPLLTSTPVNESKLHNLDLLSTVAPSRGSVTRTRSS